MQDGDKCRLQKLLDKLGREAAAPAVSGAPKQERPKQMGNKQF